MTSLAALTDARAGQVLASNALKSRTVAWLLNNIAYWKSTHTIWARNGGGKTRLDRGSISSALGPEPLDKATQEPVRRLVRHRVQPAKNTNARAVKDGVLVSRSTSCVRGYCQLARV